MRDQLNDNQRARLAELLHYSLTEIRRLGWDGQAKQAAALADAVESLPNELFGTWVFSWDRLRTLLANYQTDYPDRPGWDFAALVDEARKAK
jgi:hypothetical protein